MHGKGTKYNRRSIRLPDFDYSSPYCYYVTICTYRFRKIFGRVLDGVMLLSATGMVAHEEWDRSGEIRPELLLDEWVVMPDHIHGLVTITGSAAHKLSDEEKMQTGIPAPAGFLSSPKKTRSLSSFVGGYKSIVTSRIRKQTKQPDLRVWQRNYYERIVRDEVELERFRNYIRNNPKIHHGRIPCAPTIFR